VNERTSLPAMIGWWSVVMLTAGFAAFLLENAPESVKAIWIQGGMLGLLSAVALESVRRYRQRGDHSQQDLPNHPA
jgi:membrane protein implicated in regulation of membrane protease activity